MAELPGNFTVRDLLRLVASEGGNARAVLERAFDWEHARRLETGKWLLATGAAAVLGALTFKASDEPSVGVLRLALLIAGGGAIAIGLGAFWMAGSVSRRLVRAASLVARLEEVRPFLQKLRAEGLL